MCKRSFSLILILFFVNSIFAQKVKFDTHAVTLKGELTKDDIFEKDFGRFDAYELNMEEGDLINLNLKADFFPLMIIVAPSSQYKMAFPKDNRAEVNYSTIIDESGLWYIYIAGDSTDTGKHRLNLCYVSKNTRALPENPDFLTTVNFFLAHSSTNFNYFKDQLCDTKDSTWEVNIEPNGVFESAKLDQKNKISKIFIKMTLAGNGFKDLFNQLKSEFGKSWNVKMPDGEERVVMSEIEGLRKMALEKSAKNSVLLTISTE